MPGGGLLCVYLDVSGNEMYFEVSLLPRNYFHRVKAALQSSLWKSAVTGRCLLEMVASSWHCMAAVKLLVAEILAVLLRVPGAALHLRKWTVSYCNMPVTAGSGGILYGSPRVAFSNGMAKTLAACGLDVPMCSGSRFMRLMVLV